MQFKKLAAMAGTAVIAGMSIAAPVMAASVTQLKDFSDLVSVTDSTVSFPVFVVGATASTADVAGALNVAMNLAGEATVTTDVPVAGGEETVTGGLKFEQKDDPLFIYELLNGMYASVGGEDIPGMTSDGTITTEDGKEYDYEQQIKFEDTVAAWDTGLHTTFTTNEDDKIGTYLSIVDPSDDTEILYGYKLKFDSAVEFDTGESDNVLEGTVITWLGNEWTITDVSETGSVIDAIEMISGKATKTVLLSTPETFEAAGNEYSITLVAVNLNENKVTLDIDGVTYILDANIPKKLSDGTVVTITDIFASTKESTPDSCKVFVGARKVVLTDGDELEVNDDTVNEAWVTIDSAANVWNGFEVTVAKGSVNEDADLYVEEDGSLVDPLSGNFNILFKGITPTIDSEDRTMVELKTAGKDKVNLVFTNKDGDEITMPLFFDDTSVADGSLYLGKDADELLIQDETDDVEDGYYFILSNYDTADSHVAKLTGMDDDPAQIEIEILGAGSETFSFDGAGDGVITVNRVDYDFTVDVPGAPTSMVVDMDNSGTIGDASSQYLYTEFGPLYKGTIDFGTYNPGAGEIGYIDFYEDDGLSNWIYAEAQFDTAFDDDSDVVVIYDSSSEVMQEDGTDSLLSDEDTDDSFGLTPYGTYVSEEADGAWFKIAFSEDTSYANVYIGTDIESSMTEGGVVTTTTTIPITADIVKLDTEISATDKTTKDLVLVGGPCVNTLVAELAAANKFPYTCTTWPGENFGHVSLVDGAFASGYTAFIIAGTRAADTDLAARVVQDGTKLAALTASSAKITGTSMTDVVVS